MRRKRAESVRRRSLTKEEERVEPRRRLESKQGKKRRSKLERELRLKTPKVRRAELKGMSKLEGGES